MKTNISVFVIIHNCEVADEAQARTIEWLGEVIASGLRISSRTQMKVVSVNTDFGVIDIDVPSNP